MSASDVAIIDGGGANLASLQFALKRIGAKSILTTEPATITSASHVILPGVGAAAAAMQELMRHNLVDVVRHLEQPVLGICLGMQLLAERSAEGATECLGVLPGQAERLRYAPGLPVPNMGWCRTSQAREHQLLDAIEDGSWFYYVHSFALPVTGATIATATHTDSFSAIESVGNFHATQFHPERSAAAGSQLLRNFLAMQP